VFVMKIASPLVRIALFSAATALVAAAAFAQEAPKPKPRQGYADPAGVPVRPPAVDIEPVWARPSVDTVATIRKRGTLRVGVVANEPFVMRNADGELAGFSIDLGRQLATDLGFDVAFVPTSWSQVVPDLLGHHFDVIASGFWITPSRALVVNFSKPTSLGAVYLVGNTSMASTMKSRADFDRADVRLVVYAGSSQEVLAGRLFPRATLVKIDGDADPLAPVIEGKAHAALVTTPTPALLLADRGSDRLCLPLDAALEVSSTALAIRKGDSDFLNFLDSWLAFQMEGSWLADRQHYWFRTTEWKKTM